MEFSRRPHFKRKDRNRNGFGESRFQPRDRNRYRENHFEPHDRQPEPGVHNHIDLENTGAEPDYLKSLVDSRAKVTVVLNTGERLQGRIRYYDHHCFSIGLSAHGPRLFLRKDSVSYIAEDVSDNPVPEDPNP
jgi:sRNA-binding regulator protein Hfq